MSIFGSIEHFSESTFTFQYIIIFQTWQSLEPPTSTPGQIDRCARLVFYRKYNFQQLLFEAFFHIIRGYVELYSEFTHTFQF